jgi:orotidine-5'-phosphate decarboxylase
VAADDQKRVVAPFEAVKSGADFLVVGRPIRCAANPSIEADVITGEIARGMAHRSRI